ncbi:hypothetical protein PG995_008230 [Apiospora arundinis]
MRENLSRHMNRYLCEDLKAFEANCLSNDSGQRAAAYSAAASTSVLTYLHLEDALDSLNAPRTDLPAIVDGTPNGLRFFKYSPGAVYQGFMLKKPIFLLSCEQAVSSGVDVE